MIRFKIVGGKMKTRLAKEKKLIMESRWRKRKKRRLITSLYPITIFISKLIVRETRFSDGLRTNEACSIIT